MEGIHYCSYLWTGWNKNGAIIIKNITVINCKVLFKILLSRLNPFTHKTVRNHEYGLQWNRSTHYIFCTHQKLLKKSTTGQHISYLYTSRKLKIQLEQKCHEIFSFIIHLKTLLKIHLNETCHENHISKHVWWISYLNGLTQGDALSPLFFNSFRICHHEGVKKKTENDWNMSASNLCWWC